MKRWQKAVLWIGIGALVVGIFLWRRTGGAVYQGRGVKSWVEDFRLAGDENHTEAIKAIRAMGTNAIPELLALLRDERSWLQQKLTPMPDKLLPRSIRLPPTVHHWRAQTGLEALGKVAVPTLIESLGDSNLNYAAVEILASIGEEAIPALRQKLTNSPPPTQTQIVHVLTEMRLEARPAVPDLLRIFQTGDDELRLLTARALQWIDPETAARAGVKLKDPKSWAVGAGNLDLIIPSRATSAPPRAYQGSP